MTDATALIRAHGLVPRLDGPARPEPLECVIEPDSITCLVGEHARQRTAYLRTLGGVDPASAGWVDLSAELDVGQGAEAWSRLRCRLGFVTHSAPLLSVVNGLRNVMLPGLYHKLGSYAVLEERARTLIAEIGCDADPALLPAYLTELQRRQLAIARAVTLSPLVLMIDQPFGCLSPLARGPIADYLRRWATRKGRALVVATDDLGFVKRNATRIVHVAGEGCYCFNSWQEYAAADVVAVQRELAVRRAAMAIFD